MLTWSQKKDPEDVLDYQIDWSNKMTEGDSITNSTWEVPSGINKDSDSFDGDSTTIWLSGGTAGADYVFLNHIETALGREWDQSVKLRVRPR